MTRRDFTVLLLILFIGWISAAGSPDLIRCGVDQDVHFQRIQEMIDTGTPTLVGTTNGWLNTGPLEYYVWLPIQWLAPAPEDSVRFSALLFLVALLMLYVTLLWLTGSSVPALGITLLAALDPFILWMTRDITHLSLFFPASCLIFLGLSRQWQNPSGRGFPLALTGFLLAIQAHLAALPLLVPMVCCSWWRPPRPRRHSWFLLPSIILLLTLVPWLIHEWNTGFTDLLQRLDYHGVGEVPLRDTDNLLLRALFPARHAIGLSPEDEQRICQRLPILQWRQPLLDLIFLLAFLTLAGHEILVRIRTGRPPDPGTLLTAGWCSVLFFLFALAPRDAARYMLPFHPLVWLILAWSAVRLRTILHRHLTLLLILGLLLPAVILQVSWNLTWKQQLIRGGTIHGDLTLRSKRALLERLDAEGNFCRDDLARRFVNLNNRENHGWTWPGRMELPAGSSMPGTVAVLLPGTSPDHARHPGVLLFQPDRLQGSWQSAPALLSKGNRDPEPDSDDPDSRSQPLFLEGAGQAFDLEFPLSIQQTEAVLLAVKTRAIPYRLLINERKTAVRPVGRRRWQREVLPDVHLIPLPELPPGQHRIGLRVHLADLWSDVQAVTLPADTAIPDRPFYKHWNWVQ